MAISVFMVFTSSGMLVYWMSRTILVMRGPASLVNATLDEDRSAATTLLHAFRGMFTPVFSA